MGYNALSLRLPDRTERGGLSLSAGKERKIIMKTWKRLLSGLFALVLLASLACSALAAEGTAQKEAAKPAGPFSQWFSRLGMDSDAPEASEAVLARMGTVIRQSKTVGGVTVTLNAAVWDGTDVRLSFDIKSPSIPKEVQQYTPLSSADCRLTLREEQWKEYTRNMLTESYAGSNMTPEQVEKAIQAQLAKGQTGSLFLTPEERKGNTLIFQVNDGLFCSCWFTETKQPELTLHLENLAPYDGGKTFLKGPFDFTFTLKGLIQPVRYEGADVKVTVKDIPLRFSEFQLSATGLTACYTPLNPVKLPQPSQTLTPEEMRKIDTALMAILQASYESVRGLWTADGKYVDITNAGSSGGSDAVRISYPYPIDPATVTAINLGGTRVELSGLKLVTE